ncbi:hypothetical protein NYF23_00675 [SAR92 clade bacterium H455]|uniref:Flagellar assembly protein T N-terminal domain-containing protein n=1 Tax=SAR92 clade bacterium H455 TaxID=2974818 RepID=A0ABY5TN31_9GAMM|nr:hypothetical protein NYF23_00675 [SAR92 clade bacterium H455]
MKLSCLIFPHWSRLLLSLVMLCAVQITLASDADQRLEALKQALIDLSIDSEVRLVSSAYLDQQGVLHEASVVTSESQVRGIRVLSYLQEAGLGVADVEATVVASDCPVARSGLQREVLISIAQSTDDPRFGDHYLSELGELSEQLLTAALSRSPGWSVAPKQKFVSSYHKRMAATGGIQRPFEIQLALQPVQLEFSGARRNIERYVGAQGSKALYWGRSQIPGLASRAPWSNQAMEVELRLIDPVRGDVVVAETVQIDYPSLPRGYGKTDLPIKFIDQLTAISQRFVGQINETLECRRHYYHVSNSPAVGGESDARAEVRINAGSIAGVQVGDQFLLSPTPQISGQGASLDDIGRLVLAQVQAVGLHGATLKVTAGEAMHSRLSENFNHYVAIYF